MFELKEKIVSSRPTVYGIPLRAQAFFAIAIATTLPLAFMLIFENKLSESGEPWRLFLEAISRPIGILGFQTHFYFIFVFFLFAAGISLSMLYIDRVFVHPLRTLIEWLSASSGGNYENVPVMPHFFSLEPNRLRVAIATALASLNSTRNQNTSLTAQKSDIVLIAAHQLRTPLTGLKWSADALSNESDSSERKKQAIEDVQSAVRRIAMIVDNIVASAYIDQGTIGYSFADIDIIPVMEKGLADLALTAKQRGLKITFNHPSSVKPVLVDSYRMSTAIFNLIENAVEYTPSGGSITVSLTDQGEKLECTIEDTGIGISEKDMPFLFTKFFRSETARHMRPNGTGLGLYLVRNVVEAHGSKVNVQSTEGKGTKISFTLPYAKKA